MRSGNTTIDDNHSHTYHVDKNGNGQTSHDDGHHHIINNWEVDEVCEVDLCHWHDLL